MYVEGVNLFIGSRKPKTLENIVPLNISDKSARVSHTNPLINVF